MDVEVEEKEQIIKEKLLYGEKSDSPRGVFSELSKKMRKNRSGMSQNEQHTTNNNHGADLISSLGKLILASLQKRLIQFLFLLIKFLF